MRDFKRLDIWRSGMQIVKGTYLLIEKLPNTEKFGLKSQMCRCAVSIPSNIAEGCSRESKIELARFLEIAIGSAFELETQLLICLTVGYLENKDIESILSQIRIFQKQANTYRLKVKS